MIPRDDAEVETECSFVRYTRPEISIAPGTEPPNRCVLSGCQTRAGFDATAAARIAVVAVTARGVPARGF